MGNGVRINTINPVYHKSTESQDLPLIRISASLNHSTVSDPAVVYFNDNATPGFDQQFDALKLMNTDSRVPNLFWLNNDDEKLSISAIPYPVDTITKIPIGLETETDGEITFKASSVENIPSGLNVYLSDESTGLIQDLTLNPDYNISLSAGSHTGRFFVLFSENELTGVFNSDKTFYANVENANLNVYVKLENEGISKLLITNMPGQTLISKELSGNGKHTIRQNLAAGIYLLTLYSSQGTCSQKIYIPK
jgi:hypothetical protein